MKAGGQGTSNVVEMLKGERERTHPRTMELVLMDRIALLAVKIPLSTLTSS